MTRHFLPFISLAAVLVVISTATTSAQTSPDDVLKSKGLTRQGTYYLLDADIKLPEALKTIRQAKKLLFSYAGPRDSHSPSFRRDYTATEGVRRVSEEQEPRTRKETCFRCTSTTPRRRTGNTT